MVKELQVLFAQRFDRNTLALAFPKVFDHLKAEDALFEMVSSNTCQPMALFYQKNIVSYSYAAIFINTRCCQELEYKGAQERCELAKDLFIEVLEFDDFVPHENLRKSEIVNILTELDKKADEFAEKCTAEETFLLSIVWIGYSLDCDFAPHQEILAAKDEEIANENEEAGKSGGKYFKWMEVSAYGEPICINEYATRIAAHPSTHVLQLNDFQSENPYQIKKEHIDYNATFYELVLESRSGRSNHTFIYECDIE